MKAFFKLILAGSLICSASLAQACDIKNQGSAYFQEMDVSGDGTISKKEFDTYHKAHFKEIDANKDGKITQAEMDAVHSKKVEKCDVQLDKRFDKSDIDNDGALSKDEAEIGMPAIFRHFDEFDVNKDGKISSQEMSDFMKKMHANHGSSN